MALRVLVAYAASSTHVQTTLDYLNSLKSYLDAEVSYVNVIQDAQIGFDLEAYDVVFHNYCARLCLPGYVSGDYLARLSRFSGLKILAVQDEYDHTDLLKQAILDCGFHVVLTCVPQGSLEYVYPAAEFSHCRFETVLTGYVPDDFADKHPSKIPLPERKITIGYRGRDIGGFYGRLAFDKYDIGRRFQEICRERGIVSDIAMDERSRIYGLGWFDFVGSCRTMLGTESGSNVFDFNGGLARLYREMEATRGRPISYEEFLPIVAQKDSEISMGQISPRVFECAVMRTAMVLYRGSYSGAIQADEHYIALEKDYSNLEEVLRKVDDLPFLEAMTARAYDHLVGSGAFGYRTYNRRLRAIIDEELPRMRAEADSVAARPQPAATSALQDGPEPFVELPTAAPLPQTVFTYRSNMPLLGLYQGEIERILASVEATVPACVRERNRLLIAHGITSSAYRNAALPSLLSFDLLVERWPAFSANVRRVTELTKEAELDFAGGEFSLARLEAQTEILDCVVQCIAALNTFVDSFNRLYDLAKTDIEHFDELLQHAASRQSAALRVAPRRMGFGALMSSRTARSARLLLLRARRLALRAVIRIVPALRDRLDLELMSWSRPEPSNDWERYQQWVAAVSAQGQGRDSADKRTRDSAPELFREIRARVDAVSEFNNILHGLADASADKLEPPAEPHMTAA